MAMAIAPVPQDIAEDRIHGLLWQMNAAGTEEEPTELWHRVTGPLYELASATARVHPDQISDLVAGMLEQVKARIVRAASTGEGIIRD